MRIAVATTGVVLTESLKTDVRRRVLLVLSRFGQEVQGVTVRLTESHNPLGGVDRRCRVRARLRTGAVLMAEAVNGDLDSAVGRSSDRLARVVAAELDGGDGRPWPLSRGSDE